MYTHVFLWQFQLFSTPCNDYFLKCNPSYLVSFVFSPPQLQKLLEKKAFFFQTLAFSDFTVLSFV